MTDAEIRLAALLAADEPPVHDRLFEGQVMARVEQRRSLVKLAQMFGYAVTGVAVALIALTSLVQAFGLTQDEAFNALWPIGLSIVVTLACFASAWRYLKPLTDWRLLTSWI